uniref:Sideroflexin-3 n=1 Tax=Eptatretus burgeri TaxID=7764 RepID=A0A8C4NMU5_EPTBU
VGKMSATVLYFHTINIAHRSTPAVLFWQWINQSFNAVVNYTNRSGDAPITVNQLGTAYVCATTGAVITALGLNSLTKHVTPLIGRFVPFAAVAAANCINIPFMRQRELKHGIPVFDDHGKRLGESEKAAQQAIGQVIVSRIGMAAPGMGRPQFNHFPPQNIHYYIRCTCILIIPSLSSIAVTRLEPSLQEHIRENGNDIQTVYFNKGL